MLTSSVLIFSITPANSGSVCWSTSLLLSARLSARPSARMPACLSVSASLSPSLSQIQETQLRTALYFKPSKQTVYRNVEIRLYKFMILGMFAMNESMTAFEVIP